FDQIAFLAQFVQDKDNYVSEITQIIEDLDNLEYSMEMPRKDIIGLMMDLYEDDRHLNYNQIANMIHLNNSEDNMDESVRSWLPGDDEVMYEMEDPVIANRTVSNFISSEKTLFKTSKKNSGSNFSLSESSTYMPGNLIEYARQKHADRLVDSYELLQSNIEDSD